MLDEGFELLLLLAGESGGEFKEGGVLGLHAIHFLLGVGVQYLVAPCRYVVFWRGLLCALGGVETGDDGGQAGEFVGGDGDYHGFIGVLFPRPRGGCGFVLKARSA